jgi:hypothetical protein
LYIRPFDQEFRPFVRAREFNGGYGLTFEECFSDARGGFGGIGRITALGSPSDRLFPTVGRRFYQADETWSSEFLRLAHLAACIVTFPAISANTTWELRQLRNSGYHTKLFVVTPFREDRPPVIDIPPLSPWARWCTSLIADLYEGPWQLVARSLKVASASRSPEEGEWARWVENARTAELTGPAYPGPGSVVAFQPSGQAVVLVKGAAQAKIIARSISSHLSSQ